MAVVIPDLKKKKIFSIRNEYLSVEGQWLLDNQNNFVYRGITKAW